MLTLIPFFGLIMPFVLLVRGNEWAWKNKEWQSVEQFKIVQRQWARWGRRIAVPCIIIPVSLYFVMSGIKSSYYYNDAINLLKADSRVVTALGSPVEPGWYVMGSVETSGPGGKANITIPLSGTKTYGTAHLLAEKQLGQWSIKGLVVEVGGTGERIPIILPDAASNKRSPDAAERNPETANWQGR
jgi:hypothetical protein